MRKAACYCMTRNLYEKALPSIRSLCELTKLDALYLVIEDDEFPFQTPGYVRIINGAGQTFFPPDGPNYHQKWTYMALMRSALCHLIPEEEAVLSLDVDTVMHGDISAVWEYDLTGYYLAGCREPYWTEHYKRLYVNMGVALFNLSALRDGKADEIIRSLNTAYSIMPEQDLINEKCAGRILEIPSRFNANPFTLPTDTVLIRHHAANPNWFFEPDVQAWMLRATKE